MQVVESLKICTLITTHFSLHLMEAVFQQNHSGNVIIILGKLTVARIKSFDELNLYLPLKREMYHSCKIKKPNNTGQGLEIPQKYYFCQ